MASQFLPLPSPPPIPLMFPLPRKFMISSLITRFEIWYEVPVCQNICSLDVKINTILVGYMLPRLYYYSGKNGTSGNEFPVF